jgi:hypothetical protein
MKQVLLLILFLVVVEKFPANSTDKIIQVFDCDVKSPIKDVNLYFQHINSSQWIYIGLTDSNGLFRLIDSLGLGKIRLYHVAFETLEFTLFAENEYYLCLNSKIYDLKNIDIAPIFKNPFVSVKGGSIKIGKEKFKVSAFSISQKEISIWEFEEFVRETGYLTEVEKFRLPGIFYSRVVIDSVSTRLTDFYLNLYRKFRESDYDFNKHNSMTHYGQWRFVRSLSDTLKWYHNEFGEDMRSLNPAFPVIRITYKDAVAFANWVGGRLPKKEEYLLLMKNEKSKDGWHINYSGGLIHPTGKSRLSRNGIFDFYGNVGEYFLNENLNPFEVEWWGSDRYSSPFTEIPVRKHDNYIELYSNPPLIVGEFIGFRVVMEK